MPNQTDTLRAIYGEPSDFARRKTLPQLDAHCRSFLALSPFFCLGTQGPSGGDVSPRGDQPGFVHVLDDSTLAIPDWRGNNRIDSLTNIAENSQVGLLFLIPGVDETLRINGMAEISMDPELLARWENGGNHPKSALIVTVKEAFIHCAKALIRSQLWKEESRIDRAELPSLAQILKDQLSLPTTVNEMEVKVASDYKNKLY